MHKQWLPVDLLIYNDDHPVPEDDPRMFRSIHGMWPSWHAEARCLGVSETTFFGSSEPDERPPYTLTDIKNARSLCYGCPVFDECLADALERREEYGVWAATTRKERQHLFRILDQGFMNIHEVISYVRRKHGVV